MKKTLLFIGVIILFISIVKMCNSYAEIDERQEFLKNTPVDIPSKTDNVVEVQETDSMKISNAIETLNSLSSYSGNLTIEGMNSNLDALNSTIKTYKLYNASKKSEIVRLTNKLKIKIIKTQVKLFPKYRKAYANEIKNKLWENNIKVSIQNKTLTLTGGTFASNKNKKDAFDVMHPIIKRYRFKRINFKWYEYDDEYTYWTIDSQSDNEI